jgi:hypothetical protein
VRQPRECRTQVPKPAPDSGGCELAWRGRFLPWMAQVLGQSASQAQLGVGDEQQPGPAVGGLGGAQFGAGPAEGLFPEAVGVLKQLSTVHLYSC